MKDDLIKNENEIQNLENLGEDLSALESEEITGGYDDKNYVLCGANVYCPT